MTAVVVQEMGVEALNVVAVVVVVVHVPGYQCQRGNLVGTIFEAGNEIVAVAMKEIVKESVVVDKRID